MGCLQCDGTSESWITEEALDVHTTMSTQALGSETLRLGLKDLLLNYAGLYEELRKKVG